LATKYKLSIKE